ncbi:Protein FAR1-RELATED SEQUENCE 6 [Bienertia sinuspersici]
MECAGGVGRDDAVDDVIDVNECDELYDSGSDAATGAEINRGSGSRFIIGDDGTQREHVRGTWNGDGLVTPTVRSVYNNWEEVERMFKEYGKKKGFGVIRGQSAYYGGTKNKHALTMRCECYGCLDTKIKKDEKKGKRYGDRGCSGEELIQQRRRKSKKCSSLKVALEYKGHNPKPGQAKLVKQYRMEHFTSSMRSRVFNDIDAGNLLANIHGMKYTRNLLTGIPLEKYFQRIYADAKFRAFLCECERLMYCYVKEEVPNGDHMYSYVIEDRVWKTGKGGIHEYLTPKRRMYHCVHKIEEKEIECSCKMFETHGILCHHAIRVLDMNLYEEPPEKYVL